MGYINVDGIHEEGIQVDGAGRWLGEPRIRGERLR